MPNRVQWEARYRVGNETLDQQHQTILAQCNALADCLDAGDTADEQGFDAAFAALTALAREHFASEEALLAERACTELDDHRAEQEEYEFLAAEIVTTANFDRSELQTFLALWWIGHVTSAAINYRVWFEKP